jgi:SAM-dependent methyltransferase
LVNFSAGDVDYHRHGIGYARHRRTDRRIAQLVLDALGPAGTVVNVGAGAGSYEPGDRPVIAIEPSEAMIAQREPGAAPVLRGVAEALPLADRSVDGAMAMVTVHQWPNPVAGLGELRRVSRGPVVVLTFDPDALDTLWLVDYSPELYAAERARYPTMDAMTAVLGPDTIVRPVPVPLDCVDGFTEAYYGRPEQFLDPAARAAQSAWSFVDDADEERSVRRLADDLASGRWDERHGYLRHQPVFIGALRLVVSAGSARDHRWK